MRPQELKLKNFGPFIDETIDFSRLTEAALFLISGKTGTGKTTIFDGMTYALFGETSGRVRSGKEMRSSFAAPTDETSVMFTFEHQDLLYKIERKPEQQLKKKRGTGNREQTTKAELTICQPDGKEIRQYTKIKEINAQINELLHLDVKQFSQIVLLPQGDFRTFLNANSEDKEAVLRHLFGTEIYQRFAEKLKDKLRVENKNLSTSNTQLELLKEQFIWEEAPDTALSHPAFIESGEGWNTRTKKALAEDAKALANLEAERENTEQAYYQAKELHGFFDQKDALELKRWTLAAQQAKIEQQRADFLTYEWADKQRGLLEKNDELTANLEALAKNEKVIQTSTAVNQSAMKDHQTAQQAFDSQLTVYEQNQERSQELKRQIPLLKELQNKKTEKNQLEKKHTSAQQQQEQLKAQSTALTKELAEHQQQSQQAAPLQKEQNFINQCNIELKEVRRQEDLAAAQKEKLAKKQAEQQLLSKEISQNQQVLEEKEQQQAALRQDSLKMQIAHLSAMLKPGEPCPVCGSLEHPVTHDAASIYQLEEILATEKQVEEIAVILADGKEQLTKLETRKNLTEQQIAEFQQQLAEYQQEAKIAFEHLKSYTQQEKQQAFAAVSEYVQYIQQQQELVTSGLAAVETAKGQIISLTKDQAQLQQQTAENEGQINQLAAATSQVEGAITSLINQGVQGEAKALEQEQAELSVWLTNYDNKKQTLAEELQSLKQTEVRLSEQQLQNTAQQQKTQENLTQQKEKLSAVLAERKPAITVAELRQLLTKTTQIETLRQTLAAYETQVKVNQAQLKDLTTKIEGKTKPELTEFEAALDQARAAVKAFQESYYQKKNRLEKNQRTMADFTKLYEKNQAQLDLLKELSELTRTINGDNPKKMSLERYVLRTYLSEVLFVANQRLARLTRNRYQFELSDATGSYRNQTGLEINVYDDDAGTSRSAHTLSGGESFIAALALALSLAEVIQSQAGGISIEALFIDEGFGSLDEDALNMAMEALETIESEGRMIGIISHVRELKERVPQQVLVASSGCGQSTIAYQY